MSVWKMLMNVFEFETTLAGIRHGLICVLAFKVLLAASACNMA